MQVRCRSVDRRPSEAGATLQESEIAAGRQTKRRGATLDRVVLVDDRTYKFARATGNRRHRRNDHPAAADLIGHE
jgi:hypothetical protein